MKLTLAIIAATAAFATTASAGNFSPRDIAEGTSVVGNSGQHAGSFNFSSRYANENGVKANTYSFSTKSMSDTKHGGFLR